MQRLGKNLGGYFGERITIADVLGEIRIAAQATGWTSESFYSANGFDWLGFRRKPSPSFERRVYISAGIHGDEPAGPLAALRLFRENNWPDNTDIVFCPCLNPVGFTANTRENGQGVDLNRDYLHFESPEIRAHTIWLAKQPAFDFALCLHEDWESHGFYIYELNPDGKPSLAEPIVAGVEKVCPIDQSEIIEDRPAKGGIIRPSIDPKSRPQWPEAFWLISNKTRRNCTLEAPSDFPLSARVDALVAGVNAALNAPV